MMTKRKPTTNNVRYETGDRVNFIWRKPYEGITPGTIVDIDRKKKKLTVNWDDHKSCTCSFDFMMKNTKKVDDEKEK